jgi:hypothetical protein
MAFGNSAKVAELEAEIRLLKTQIEDLKEQRNNYREEVISLRDALVAKESPAYWQDKKYAEYEAKQPPADQAAIDRQRKIHEMTLELQRVLEDPMFDNGDDFISKFTEAIGSPELQSIHGNSES